MLSFVGGTAVGGGGGGGATITLQDLVLDDLLGAGTCSYGMLNNGVAQGTEISDFDWCSPGAAAGNYEVYVSQVSEIGSPTLTGSALDTWLVLSSSRTWTITSMGYISFAVAVRDTATQTTQATCNLSLNIP
jgi:hypothetical protein